MYRIIGGDGREYGPVSLEQLKQWIAEGRANAQTRVCAEGSTEWKALAEFPELAVALPLAPPAGGPASAVVPPTERVRPPAIFLLILAVLDLVGNLFSLGLVLLADRLPLLLALEELQRTPTQKIWMLVSLPACVLGVLLAVLRLFGSIQMLRMRSHGLAMTTAILTLVPFTACCCLVNIPVGIWALVVLSKPEVKSAFQ